MRQIVFFNLLTAFAAFLLFQIELITAKILLPNYGGSFMVWGACMVFFQAALLAGYAFSHVLLEKMGVARYKILYLVLIVIPLFFFPGKILRFGLPNGTLPLSLDIFYQLLMTIGPVFFVLATVSIFTQVWLASSNLPEKDNPYALYGWSNLGSFGALLTYPFFFEYYFDLQQQLMIWRISYFVLIALSVVMFVMIRVNPLATKTAGRQELVGRKDIIAWLLLSGGGVMMFLSVTNILTMEIAPIPLLWIIPLAIYLLTFILNFKERPWCPRWINSTIHWTIGSALVVFFLLQHQSLPVFVEISLLLGMVFIVSMYCQHQLIVRKPVNAQQLTFFYLMISLGGFVGGLLTSWIIPLVFSSIAEYLVALILVALTLPNPVSAKVSNRYTLRMILYFFLFLFIWPMYFYGFEILGLVILIVVCWLIIRELGRGTHGLVLTLLLAVILMPYLEMAWEHKVFIYKKRNYYGIYKIFDRYGMRTLHHGTILHGMQFKDPAMRHEPTAYFGRHSPVGTVLLSKDYNFKSIGIVGLGAGTLATYFHDQNVDFYELDPDVIGIAEKYFSFVTEMSATGRFVIGDARVALTMNSDVKYDLLIVDAFSGDSVPAHLLTKEMFAIYQQRLSAHGMVLFHISNRYLNLDRVVGRVAESVGAYHCFATTVNPQNWEIPSEWMAMTWDSESFQKLTADRGWQLRAEDPNVRPWTDQYMNVVPILKWDVLSGFFRKS
jgi:spermidine synthase